MKTNKVVLKNPRTGEVWLCEDYSRRRNIDGADFVEVRSPSNNRNVWIALNALVRVRDPKTISDLLLNQHVK